MNTRIISTTAAAIKPQQPSWLVRYIQPNAAGRISVKLWEKPSSTCHYLSFSLSLQQVLSYDLFKREASRATGTPFRYEPAERDPSGAAWLELLQARTRYPERDLTDKWAEHCPGSTRKAKERRGIAERLSL